MRAKKLFTEYLAEPSKLEEKWLIVGFFSAVMLFGSIMLPLLVLSGELREAVALSPYWFALMGGMLGWLIAYWATLKYWWRLSFNFGWLMYITGERDQRRKEAKKAAKLALKTQQESNNQKT